MMRKISPTGYSSCKLKFSLCLVFSYISRQMKLICTLYEIILKSFQHIQIKNYNSELLVERPLLN